MTSNINKAVTAMRTIVCDRQGDPSRVLRLETTDPPGAPAPGQVVIRVLARPVHPGDLAGIEGFPGLPSATFDPPRSPGLEGYGVVEATAADGLAPGTRVAFFPVPGAWSEYVTAPADLVVPVPDDVSDSVAALMLVNPLTLTMLLRAVRDAGAGVPGRPLLQTAAGSSIGALVSSAALRHGFPVINLVRSDAGAAALRDRFPALPAISTSWDGWREQVRAAAGGQGPPTVLDAVGGELTGDLVALLADGGTLITYGRLGAGTTALDSLALTPRGLTVRGVSVGHWLGREPAERAEDVAFARRLAQTDPELFAVAGTHDLADYLDALAHVRRPGRTGTVLLTSPAS
ncbi:zinc-binding dehydrogenase [Pseudonocardia spinosispora]|uniref:zinc-binding dehydrogenase n=1 Tax=Pseudonocardia spinosispora TaxID=103441 RepID=UPI001B7F88B4|nr:zinc-binding dehydrogenase [Pseudonocardia spinosispora]